MPSYGSMGGQSDWLLGENPPSGRRREASYSGNPFASAAVEARTRHSWQPMVRVVGLLLLVVLSLASFVLGPGLTPSSGLLEDAAKQNRELRAEMNRASLRVAALERELKLLRKASEHAKSGGGAGTKQALQAAISSSDGNTAEQSEGEKIH